ncbi:MAG: ATP-binding protein [Desulfobacteraceae bacterium]|nr:ATP-binding protein [Desulfobacteraceae bacterium]
MLLVMEPGQALVMIDTPRLAREDTIIPNQLSEQPDSPYQPEYNWLYVYERQLFGFLEQWLRPYRHELIGEKGILCEALSNAFCHGHGKDPQKPIVIYIFEGKKGLLIRIKDNGRGFDVQKVFQQFCGNKQYYSTAGNGIRRMAESPRFGIFYDSSGSAFHLLYFYDGALECVPPNAMIAPESSR